MKRLNLNSKVYFITFMTAFFSIFSGCNSENKINNKYLTVTVPKDYVEITQGEDNDILFLDRVTENDLESIFSVDNTQDITIQPNSQTIKEFTPKERLASRLESIEADTKMTDFNWKNFKITNPPKEITFKKYKAAEAIFTVDENVNNTGKIIQKKIKRIIVFTNNDLWNFVLTPSELSNYDKEMKIFEDILESLEIK